jgi:hypothetical protein
VRIGEAACYISANPMFNIFKPDVISNFVKRKLLRLLFGNYDEISGILKMASYTHVHVQ